MNRMLVYPIGTTEACLCCGEALKRAGVPLLDHPAPEVTHLLLDVPSFGADGLLRGGGDIQEALRMLPQTLTVVGGSLFHPALKGYRTLDLLRDDTYLSVNAAITAECALELAARNLRFVFFGCSVLVIGWGRIGKCLAQQLKGLGADVTVAARKESDRAMLRTLGYRAVHTVGLGDLLRNYRVVFNTVPELLLHKEDTATADGLLIDLASRPGMEGERVITARGLPGIYKPESAGLLMAEVFLRRSGEDLSWM